MTWLDPFSKNVTGPERSQSKKGFLSFAGMVKDVICFLCCLTFLICCDAYQLDVPIAFYEPGNLTVNPCVPKPYVTKLSHSTFELHWLDNNPSVILYPIINEEISYENCLILDLQGWRERGGNFSNPCNITRSLVGTYSFTCAFDISPFESMKENNWTFTQTDSNITWSTTLDNGAITELFFEIIEENTTRNFTNADNTGLRTLKLLQDSFEFSCNLKNYTLQNQNNEVLEGEYYGFEVVFAILMSAPVTVLPKEALPGLPSDLALTSTQIWDYFNGGPFVRLAIDAPNYDFKMRKRDGSYNISLALATFVQSEPISYSKRIAAIENRTDLIGFDPVGSIPIQLFYYKGSIVGQSFAVSFAMSMNGSQSVYFDPNISIVYGQNNDGSDASTGLIVGLTVGLVLGALVIIIIIGVVIVVVVAKRKHDQAQNVIL